MLIFLKNFVLTIYHINVALLRKMSYDDIRKLDSDSLEYLSLICITNNKKVFAGAKNCKGVRCYAKKL